jgi:hypothetical protein
MHHAGAWVRLGESIGRCPTLGGLLMLTGLNRAEGTPVILRNLVRDVIGNTRQSATAFSISRVKCRKLCLKFLSCHL